MKSLIKNVKAKILANKGSDTLETVIKIVAYTLVAALALGGLALAIKAAVGSSASYVEASTACALNGAQAVKAAACPSGQTLVTIPDADKVAGFVCCK